MPTWNQTWNQAWNYGYNNPTGGLPMGGGQLAPGFAEGYKAGQQERTRRGQATLGASTQRTSGGGGSSAPSQPMTINMPQDDSARRAEEERNAERARLEGYINDYEGRVKGFIPELEQNQQEEIDSTGRTYGLIQGGLQEQKAANLAKIGTGREQVNSRRAGSLEDLKRNLAETLRGSMITLGGMGAGDTSASRVMLPYAYNKIAGKEAGGIMRQANDQQFQLDSDERDTELEFSKMWRQTEVEKETTIQGVKDKYGQLLFQVQQQLANIPTLRAQVSQSLLDRADAELRQIQAEDRQRKSNIQTWATQRMSELNNMKLSIANNANFNPTDIVWNELSPLMGATSTTGTQAPAFNPLALAQKRRDDYLGIQ